MQDDTGSNEGGWSFHAEEARQPAQAQATIPQNHPAPVSWTASEFIANHKSPLWYMGLFSGTILLSVLIFFVFHDIISVVFIVIVSILFAALGGKKPRQLRYLVDDKGITIGGRFYPYSMFKSFSVLQEGPIGYINLMPLRRFMPEISIYFALEDEERIVDALADSLPYEHRDESLFDHFMKKLHF